MWLAFFWENAHFAINCFAALVFFAMFWLYFDAWLGRKVWDEVPKLLGILLISLSFIIHATQLETRIIITSLGQTDWQQWAFLATRLLGYIFMIIGVILDPLQPAPKTKGLAGEVQAISVPFGAQLTVMAEYAPLAIPILCVAIAWMYLRRATVGLEKHLKIVTISFFVLSVAELMSLADVFLHTNNVSIYQFVAPFAPLWIAQHLVMLVGVTILGSWVWQYLTKRLQAQLFMIFTASILGIFLLTTSVFTGLLLKNLQDETLLRLETDVKVLNYGIESRKERVLSDATLLTQQEDFIKMVEEDDKVGLSEKVQKFLLGKNLSFLVVVDDTGRVLARGEDKDRVGDSLSEDSLVKRALNGQELATVYVKDGVLSPEISVRGVAPIRSGKETIGAIIAGEIIDNAFVDGIKEATGLEAAIYGNNILAATTQISADGKSRWVGTQEQTPEVKTQVLEKGESYSGLLSVLNTPYLVSYMAVKDMDGAVVGMLFVGRPQATVLAVAAKSIEVTFITTAILMMLAILPAYKISKFIAEQLS
jgi:hypothetical protein